jgi:hypothetical protein
MTNPSNGQHFHDLAGEVQLAKEAADRAESSSRECKHAVEELRSHLDTTLLEFARQIAEALQKRT